MRASRRRRSSTSVSLPRSHWKAGRPNRAFGSSPPNSGPNRANTPYVWPTRSRVRDSVRNSPLAARAVDLLVSELVGTGVVPLFNVSDDDHKRLLSELWRDFVRHCDYSGQCDLYGQQTLAVRAVVESGECFVHLLQTEHGQFCINILEADMVPLHNGTAPNGNDVITGIEIDKKR